MNIIKAIVIKTNVTFSTDYWGLYATAGNSEFRFSEKQLSGVTNTYHPEFITKNGIPDIVKTCDLSESGGVVQSTDITIRIKNTNQFDKFLESNGISLLKSAVEFYTYVGTDADSDSVIGRCDGVRTIESVEYTETELILKVKMSLTKQRNKRLSATLDLANYPYAPESNADKLIPVLFGSSDPINDRYFKILQSVDKNNLLLSSDYFDGDITTGADYSYKCPVPENSTDTNAIKLHLGYYPSPDTVATNINTNYSDWFEGKYLCCVNGISENSGTVRKIKTQGTAIRGTSYGTDPIEIEFTLQDFLPKNVIGNYTYDETDQHYFTIQDIDIKFILSYYKILGMYENNSDTVKPDQPNLYSKVNDLVEPIQTSSVDIDLVNNVIDFEPRIFSGSDLAKLLNYEIMPIDSIDFMDEGLVEHIFRLGSTELSPGLFAWGTSPTVGDVTVTDSEYCYDRAKNTSYYLSYSDVDTDGNNETKLCFSISLPKIPRNKKTNKIYLGVNFQSYGGNGIHGAGLYTKRYLQPIDEGIPIGVTLTGVLTVDNIPDFYYLYGGTDTGNKAFFYDNIDLLNGDVSGYKLLEIPADSADDFNSIEYLGLVLSNTSTNVHEFTVNINELCIIFEYEQSVSSEVYA